MRLVDADKAENNLYGFTRYTGIDEAPYEHAETVISKLPTIEAIPVEWLNEYAHKLIKLEQSQPVACRWFSVLGENILQMIHDWRKEMGAFDDLLPNCVKHAKVMKEIENQLEDRNGK